MLEAEPFPHRGQLFVVDGVRFPRAFALLARFPVEHGKRKMKQQQNVALVTVTSVRQMAAVAACLRARSIARALAVAALCGRNPAGLRHHATPPRSPVEQNNG